MGLLPFTLPNEQIFVEKTFDQMVRKKLVKQFIDQSVDISLCLWSEEGENGLKVHEFCYRL